MLKEKIKEKKYQQKYRSRIRRAKFESSEEEDDEVAKETNLAQSRAYSSTSSVSLSSCIIKGMKKRDTQFKSLSQK